MKATVISSKETKKGNFFVVLSYSTPTPFGGQQESRCAFFCSEDVQVGLEKEFAKGSYIIRENGDGIPSITFL